MARMMESEPAPDLALHPSPVLTEAVLKVEQVVARLQDLQTTISGLHLSPVNPKHTRASRTSNATSRVLSSKERTSSTKDGAGSSQHRVCESDEYKRNYKPGTKVHREQTTKSKGTLSSPSPSNQVHDVISEILMASQFAKQIATLVAEALQEAPQKATHPRSQSCKNGKQKDIPFPSIKTKPGAPKTSITKPKDAKSAPKSKDAKLAPGSKLIPAAKSSREVSKRRVSREGSSPDSLSPPRLVVHSPEQKRRNQRLFVSPESSFRDSGDADDELSFPRRASTNVTEIRGQTKPWKRTPTKGVLFSNPVYLCTSPTRAPRPSPTSGRRRNLLPNQQLMPSDGNERKEPSRSGNPLRTSISKVTFKREGGASKSEVAANRVRKSIVEMVPHRTMSEVLKRKDRGESRAASRYMLPLNALTDRNVVVERRNEMVKPPDSNAESKHEETVGVDVLAEKENVPSCAMFLRSMSGAHTLTRTLSRKNSGGSLFRRAKGWMSSQAIRPGKGLELER